MIYDAENRMTALEKSENGTEILQQTNVYNGDGQRIRKSESGSALAQAETNRDYFYQDGTVLYTRDSGGQNDFNVIGSEGNIIASSRISGGNEDWFIYNRDIRGSVTSIYDSSEELAAEYDYDEYGNTNVLAEDGIENEFGYTGQIYDRNTGLYYYNARFYDSETGRFTSRDTYRGEQKDADTYHLYAYCANNPINYVDPSGRYFVRFFNRMQCQNMYALLVAAEYTTAAIEFTNAKPVKGLVKIVSKQKLRKYIKKIMSSKNARRVLSRVVANVLGKYGMEVIATEIIKSAASGIYNKFKRGIYKGGYGYFYFYKNYKTGNHKRTRTSEPITTTKFVYYNKLHFDYYHSSQTRKNIKF